MVRIRETQVTELQLLKMKTFNELVRLIPGYSIAQEKLNIGESLVINISLTEQGDVFVSSIAKEADEVFVSKIVSPGKSYAMKPKWEDGFYMDKVDRIREMHPEIFDDD